MQIHSNGSNYDCLSSRQRSNGDSRTYMSPNTSTPDSSRMPQISLAGPKPVPLRAVRAAPTSHSACSWREKVVRLFDPALQDAEDLMLSLPYTTIRVRTDDLANVLDGMGSSGLDESSDRQCSRSRTSTRACNDPTWSVTSARPDRDSRSIPSDHASSTYMGGHTVQKHHCDPSRIKKAIYACYESLVAIIVSYNQSLGHETEMQARRALTAALSEMDKLVT